jgi:hypothetical protein
VTDTSLDTFQILLIIIIPAIISGIPAIISALAARKNKRKIKSESQVDEGNAADKVTTAYERLVEDLQLRIDKMEARQNETDAKVERQGKRIRHLEHGVFLLISQVKSLGAEPVFDLTIEEMGTDNGQKG